MKAYRKSYNVKSYEEIHGWRESSVSYTDTNRALQIIKPYKVKSLAELHKSPKYPDYKPEKSLFPLLSSSSVSHLLSKPRLLMTKPKISIREVYSPGHIYLLSPESTNRLNKNHFSLSTKSSSSWLDINSPKKSFDFRKTSLNQNKPLHVGNCDEFQKDEEKFNDDGASDEQVKTIIIEKSVDLSKYESKSTEFPENHYIHIMKKVEEERKNGKPEKIELESKVQDKLSKNLNLKAGKQNQRLIQKKKKSEILPETFRKNASNQKKAFNTAKSTKSKPNLKNQYYSPDEKISNSVSPNFFSTKSSEKNQNINSNNEKNDIKLESPIPPSNIIKDFVQNFRNKRAYLAKSPESKVKKISYQQKLFVDSPSSKDIPADTQDTNLTPNNNSALSKSIPTNSMDNLISSNEIQQNNKEISVNLKKDHNKSTKKIHTSLKDQQNNNIKDIDDGPQSNIGFTKKFLNKNKSAGMSLKALTEKAIGLVSEKDGMQSSQAKALKSNDVKPSEARLSPIIEEKNRQSMEIKTPPSSHEKPIKKQTKKTGKFSNGLADVNEKKKESLEGNNTEEYEYDKEDLQKNKKQKGRKNTKDRNKKKKTFKAGTRKDKNRFEERKSSDKSSSIEEVSENSSLDKEKVKNLRKITGGKIKRSGSLAMINNQGFARKGTIKGGTNKLLPKDIRNSLNPKAKPKINIIYPDDKINKSRIKRTSTLGASIELFSASRNKKNKRFKRTSTTLGKSISSYPQRSSFVFIPTSPVERFISNYSMSMVGKLQVLLCSLEEDLVNITNMNNLQIENLAPIPLSAKTSYNSSSSHNKTIKKLMKVELELVLKPLSRNKSTEAQENMCIIADNIKSSIFSDGMKMDLINYARKSRFVKKPSRIEQGMMRIIKKRLRKNKKFDGNNDSSEDSFSRSSSDDDIDIAFEDSRSRDLKSLKYEMNLNTSTMSKRSLRSFCSDREINKEELKDLENFSCLSEDYRFIGDKDVNSELFLMKWCNALSMKKFLLTSQVNFNNLKEDDLCFYEHFSNENVEGDVDINNLESRMLKNRFYALKGIANNPIDDDFYSLAITSPDELNPTEQKNLEVQKIRKSLRRMRYKKHLKKLLMRQLTIQTFSNLIKLK